jgi:hypothetical protein
MFKDNLNGIYVGIVEHNIDPKRRGRVKIRIDKLHGRTSDVEFIPTDDLPWASPELENRGLAFDIPDIGKVMHVTFLDGDRYSPVYINAEHYNYNLQGKLQSLSDESYAQFYAIAFDDKHQYYHDKDQGIMFDYVKSNMNIDPKGNMRMNLRDNLSKLFLGTEDASQQSMLGNHWMNWFDKFVHNLIGAYGGPYLGNLGAPVLPNPAMIQVMNEYYALRETFLSQHVMVVDNQRVKAQTRGFDATQKGDGFNDEKQEIIKTPEQRGYEPEERVEKDAVEATPEETAPEEAAKQEVAPEETAPVEEPAKIEDGIKTIKNTKFTYKMNMHLKNFYNIIIENHGVDIGNLMVSRDEYPTDEEALAHMKKRGETEGFKWYLTMYTEFYEPEKK